ncbi:MAG: hypothetical protein K2Q12_03805 [Rickettsiales bacterium]|nr:hypothetical protein [Rickettsiales bacterium]
MVSGAGVGAGVGAVTGAFIGGPFSLALAGVGLGGAVGIVTEPRHIYLGEPLWKPQSAPQQLSGEPNSAQLAQLSPQAGNPPAAAPLASRVTPSPATIPAPVAVTPTLASAAPAMPAATARAATSTAPPVYYYAYGNGYIPATPAYVASGGVPIASATPMPVSPTTPYPPVR